MWYECVVTLYSDLNVFYMSPNSCIITINHGSLNGEDSEQSSSL